GTYRAQANSTFLIQFFSNAAADISGNYEGQTFIGSTVLKTDASGTIIGNPAGSFSVNLSVVVPTGSWITATVALLSTTASSPSLTAGDTSAFSTSVRAFNPFLITTTADYGSTSQPILGSLRYAIIQSNTVTFNPAVPNQISFQIPGVGLQTIHL